MRVIPTFFHGIADYVVGVVVMLLPYWFSIDGNLKLTFIAVGAIAILYSAATDYELGLVSLLSVRLHLLLDAIFGVAMFAIALALPSAHPARPITITIGMLALVLAATTKSHSSAKTMA